MKNRGSDGPVPPLSAALHSDSNSRILAKVRNGAVRVSLFFWRALTKTTWVGGTVSSNPNYEVRQLEISAQYTIVEWDIDFLKHSRHIRVRSAYVRCFLSISA